MIQKLKQKIELFEHLQKNHNNQVADVVLKTVLKHLNELIEDEPEEKINYLIELNDNELKVVSSDELEQLFKDAMEYDGFLGFTVKGRVV